MNLRVFCLGVIACVAAVKAKMIDYESVHPFAQPVPVTNSEKSAVKYKPQLRISSGCYPYPAVQADGAASKGLEWAFFPGDECKAAPKLGSQVYSRSRWYKGKWAIMYAWYFPRSYILHFPVWHLHQHYWMYGIVWLDSPNPDNSTMLGVSMSTGIFNTEISQVESKFVVNDTTVKFETYKSELGTGMAIRLTTDPGETQDLITWEQLTGEARSALIKTDYNLGLLSNWVKMPLKDGVFRGKLNRAYPF